MGEEFYKGNMTYKIIGCAMAVHSQLGCGFQEVIYQRALTIELRKQELIFEREKEMTIYYDDMEIGTRRVDFLVDTDIMVELKATTKIEDAHKNQILNYIQAYDVKI